MEFSKALEAKNQWSSSWLDEGDINEWGRFCIWYNLCFDGVIPDHVPMHSIINKIWKIQWHCICVLHDQYGTICIGYSCIYIWNEVCTIMISGTIPDINF